MILKVSVLALGVAAALSLAGCNTPEGQGAAGGAVIGGATGALLGAAITNRPGGALLGGVAGAATGAMIGSAAARPQDPGYAPPPPPPPRRCAEFYYDYYGRQVCRAWY
jgi:predicted small secreted protein